MSDYLKSQFIITYQRETPPEAYKLMNSIHNDISSSRSAFRPPCRRGWPRSAWKARRTAASSPVAATVCRSRPRIRSCSPAATPCAVRTWWSPPWPKGVMRPAASRRCCSRRAGSSPPCREAAYGVVVRGDPRGGLRPALR